MTIARIRRDQCSEHSAAFGATSAATFVGSLSASSVPFVRIRRGLFGDTFKTNSVAIAQVSSSQHTVSSAQTAHDIRAPSTSQSRGNRRGQITTLVYFRRGQLAVFVRFRFCRLAVSLVSGVADSRDLLTVCKDILRHFMWSHSGYRCSATDV